MSTTLDVADANLLIDGAIPWKDVPVAQRRWFVWLFVFLFSPVAICLCWSGPVYRNVARAGVPYTRRERTWFGLVLLLLLIGGGLKSLDSAAESNGRSGQRSDTPSSSSRSDAYFTEDRFTAPSALKALYAQDDPAFEQLSADTRDVVGLYVATLADEIEDAGGKFLTANGALKEGRKAADDRAKG